MSWPEAVSLKDMLLRPQGAGPTARGAALCPGRGPSGGQGLNVLQHVLEGLRGRGLRVPEGSLDPAVQTEGFQLQPDEPEAVLVEQDEDPRGALRAGEAVAGDEASAVKTHPAGPGVVLVPAAHTHGQHKLLPLPGLGRLLSHRHHRSFPRPPALLGGWLCTGRCGALGLSGALMAAALAAVWPGFLLLLPHLLADFQDEAGELVEVAEVLDVGQLDAVHEVDLHCLLPGGDVGVTRYLCAPGTLPMEAEHDYFQAMAAVGALEETGSDEVVWVAGREVDAAVGQAVVILTGVNELHQDEFLHVLVENILQRPAPLLPEPCPELLPREQSCDNRHDTGCGEPPVVVPRGQSSASELG